MSTRKRLYLLASTTLLAAMLLTNGATTTSAPGTLAEGRIPFTRHVVGQDYSASSVHAIDLDGDGDVDVVGGSDYGGDTTWWENDGSQTFTEHPFTDSGTADSVYAIDLDGDGDVDILDSGFLGITWWENDGNQNFTERTIASDDFRSARDIYALDVDGDDDVDIVGAADWYQDPAEDIAWFENDGSESFTQHTLSSSFEGAESICATDLDSDGDVDILAAARVDGEIAWWENDGDENFSKRLVDGSFEDARDVYACDVDGDGDVDVVGAARITALSPRSMAWWENDGSELFAKHILYEDDYGLNSVHATDVDGDGDVDILGATIHDGCDEIIWWENDGDEIFTEHIVDGCFGATRIDAADVDGDGDVDVLGASGGSNEIVWWEQGKRLTLAFLPIAQHDAGPVSGAPVLNDISNPDGNGDYTVSWSAVHRATSYTLQEDDHAGFSSPVVAYSGAYTSTHITGRDVGTYYYRVNASNAFGSSEWSQVKSVEVTVSPTPPPCPDPGEWSGDTNQGYPIDFTVTSNCEVWDLTIEYVVTCPTGMMWKTKTFDYSTPIVDDDFEYDADGDPTVSGHFSSSTAANGTWSSSFYLPGVGNCSGSGTWSATAP